MTDTANPNGAAAPEPAAPDNSQAVADIMAFDPFGPATSAEAGPDKTGTTEAGGEPGGEVTEPPVEKPPVQEPPKPEPAAAQTPTQQGPNVAELQAQIAALQAVIQGAQRPQAEAKPAAEKPAKYNLGLPPQVIQGLRSEDEQEFAVAMHAVVNGIANRLWMDMQEHISKEVTPQFDQRVGAVMNHQREVDRVYNDFYGTYPHLNNPAIMPVVQNAAVAVGRQWAAQGRRIEWNKEFAEAVAATVHSIIPQPQPQQPAPQPSKPKSFVATPGARPAAAPSSDFDDVLTAR